MSENQESSSKEEKKIEGVETLESLWSEFLEQFPTESSCVAAVNRRRTDDGRPRCHHCADANVEELNNGRVLHCMSCRKNSFVTKGTFFDGVRRLKPWLAAIWLTERGVLVSSPRFAKLVEIAQSSALRIMHKVGIVILQSMPEDFPQASTVNFLDIICKRSRETPAGGHPKSEQIEFDTPEPQHGQLAPLEMESSQTVASAQSLLSKEESDVYSRLTDTPVSIEDLLENGGLSVNQLSSALSILEFEGFVIRLPGDKYARTVAAKPVRGAGLVDNDPDMDWTANIALRFKAVVRKRVHGISRKYLQIYLARYWCFVDRFHWSIGSLFDLCLSSEYILDRDLLNYVSPARVMLPPRLSSVLVTK